MPLFRFLAVAVAVLALVLLGADFLRAQDSGDVAIRSLPQWLALVGADPTVWLERNLPSSVAAAITSWPAWAPLGGLALIFAVLGWGRSQSANGGGGGGIGSHRDRDDYDDGGNGGD